MSINDIKNNADRLHELDKETLIKYTHELLMQNKKNESKIVSLRAEIKYLNRFLNKINGLINKTLEKKNVTEEVWTQNDG